MAKSKEEMKYATAQAKLSEDEALRVKYKAGTPLEGGKIANSEPADLFSDLDIHSTDRTIAESEPIDLCPSSQRGGSTKTKTVKRMLMSTFFRIVIPGCGVSYFGMSWAHL